VTILPHGGCGSNITVADLPRANHFFAPPGYLKGFAMGKRGPPALPDNVKSLRGTLRPERSHPREVNLLDGDPVKPVWLKGRAARLWNDKVATYRNRGQATRGCESALAHFCCLDAEMIEMWLRGEVPSASVLNALRGFAGQFYDTPASQIAKAAGTAAPAVNPFLARGRRPADAA
jgi:hypothetical protein